MKFNKLIADKLEPVFQKYNLQIFEQFENYIKFKSDKVVITVSYDPRENSNSLFIGKSDDFMCLIDDDVLRNIFNSDIEIDYVTSQKFINNIVVFFSTKGKPIIEGDIDTLRALEEYIYKKSEKYTNDIINRQNINAADKAWKETDYENFIKYIDKMDKEKLPDSYKLKYKISLQKLRGIKNKNS